MQEQHSKSHAPKSKLIGWQHPKISITRSAEEQKLLGQIQKLEYDGVCVEEASELPTLILMLGVPRPGRGTRVVMYFRLVNSCRTTLPYLFYNPQS